MYFILIFPFVNAQDTTEETKEYKWQARVRLISVIPVADDDIFGQEVNISHAFVPELDFTYFFTKNFAAELILGTAKHDVEVERPGFPTTDLGHVWLLPPTLNFQYHFTGGAAKPYIGAGVNYTFFYNVDEGSYTIEVTPSESDDLIHNGLYKDTKTHSLTNQPILVH